MQHGRPAGGPGSGRRRGGPAVPARVRDLAGECAPPWRVPARNVQRSTWCVRGRDGTRASAGATPGV